MAEAAGRRIFYGWVVTWTAFSVLAITYGIQFSFGVFLSDMEADTGLSRTELSLAYALYVFVYSALSGFTGSLTDRKGPKRVIAFGGVFLGVGYALTALSHSMWQLCVALGLIAAIGMSASFVPCSATVARWFQRDRGKALGFATSGGSMGGLLVPPLAGVLTSAYGWRTTYVILAAVVVVWLFVAARVIVRDPADMGLSPDGVDEPAPVAGTAPGDPADATLSEAVRTGVFWVAASVFLFTWLAVFMPLVHLTSFAEDLGVGKGLASTLISAVGVGGLFGRTTTGVVSDRLGRTPTLAAVLVLQAVAFTTFAAAGSLAVLFPAAVLFGFGYGGTTTMFPAIFSDRFGRTHVGAIVGAVFAVAGSMAAFGPALAGFLYDLTDSYRLAFAIGGAFNLIGLALVGVLRGLSRPTAEVAAAPAGAR